MVCGACRGPGRLDRLLEGMHACVSATPEPALLLPAAAMLLTLAQDGNVPQLLDQPHAADAAARNLQVGDPGTMLQPALEGCVSYTASSATLL